MLFKITKTYVKRHEKGILFLGYHIYSNRLNVKRTKNKSQCVKGVSLKFAIPLEKLFQRFADRGFFQLVKNKKNFKYIGKKVNKWLFLSNEYEIILRFNSCGERSVVVISQKRK